MATWPVSLPQQPLADGLQGERQETIIRNDTSWGPPIQRRKFSAYYEKFSLKMLMTKDQLLTLQQFYDTDLYNGSDTFDWVHPISGAPKKARFYQSYSYSYISGGYFEVNLPIEFLP
jgi:hypothetical protein